MGLKDREDLTHWSLDPRHASVSSQPLKHPKRESLSWKHLLKLMNSTRTASETYSKLYHKEEYDRKSGLYWSGICVVSTLILPVSPCGKGSVENWTMHCCKNKMMTLSKKWEECLERGQVLQSFLVLLFFFFFPNFFFFPKHLFVLFYLQPLVFQRGRLYFTSKRSGPGSSRSPGRCPAGLCPSSSPAVGRLWDLSFSGLNRAAHFWSLKEMKLKSHWRSKQDLRTKVLRWQSKQSQRRAHAARAATGPPGSAVFHKLLAEL